VKSQAEATAAAIKAGMDNECADYISVVKDNHDYQPYIDAVKQGLLTEADIDGSLKRLFTARMRLGMFDPPNMVPYANTPESEIDSVAHRQLALKTAQESMTLLKNDGVLPLASSIKNILVAGPLADSAEVLHGNYEGTASHAVTALEGIRKQFTRAHVTYVAGANLLREPLVVPTSVLSTEEDKPGLKAEYFSGALGGTPQVVRTDPVVDVQQFPADLEPNAMSLPAGVKDLFARWTGFLIPPASGMYQIGLEGSTDRMWIDGKLVIDGTQSSNAPTVTMQLSQGHRYGLKIESVGDGFGTKLVWSALSADPAAEAAEAARKADVVVAVVGINSRLEGEEMKVDLPGFHGGDRTSLNLPEEEEVLLGALKGSGKPLIVVLMNGSALAVNWANDHASAILDAWYSGEEGGTAASIIRQDVCQSPSTKASSSCRISTITR
jgi:beta-glucosidase